MINVGGYKVNLPRWKMLSGFAPVSWTYRSMQKKNAILGNIVCCEVVRNSEDMTELFLREFLRDKLQEFKIPRFVKFVANLQTTRTGKISRK